MQLEITKSSHTYEVIQQVHQQFSKVLRRQAEEIERLAHSLKFLQNEQKQLEALASQMLEHLERSLAGEANGTVAAFKTATGIRYAENVTEQPDGDDAQVVPQEATASPEIPQLGMSANWAGEPGQAKQAPTRPPAAVWPDEGRPPAAADVPDATHSPTVDEKTLRDARRFSKLLVSEIELYNRNSVEEGRRNRDLYQRLKKDIDRSRESYEKRFADTAAKQFDYFHEELVRTLAENDPLLLGTGYPGPTV